MTADDRPDTRVLRRRRGAPAPPPAEERPDTRPIREARPAPAPEEAAGEAADEGMEPGAGPRRGRGFGLVSLGVGLLLAALLGVYVEDLLLGALAAGAWTAWAAAAGTALLGLALARKLVQELAAIRRLRHLDGLQRRARAVVEGRRADDDGLLDELAGLYRGRRDLGEGLGAFEAGRARVGDTESQLGVFEARVIRQLDDQAARVIGRAVRRSGAAAAISPFPALDVAVSFYINLRLMRQVAELYGGRPGWAATLRLLQVAFTNVLAAGALDTLEDTFSDLLGGGVASKVSSKMGAAVINGLLTARLGLAAADACRPVPWTACPRPRARELARRALIDRFRPQGATGV